MGILTDAINLESKGRIVQYFKDNTTELYNQYQSPDGNLVKGIPVSNMIQGRFYFLMYFDESNWMQYSPIFFVDHKKFGDKIIGYGINMNFIPMEIRAGIFDKYLDDLEDENQFVNINFESAYKILLKVGYEYALVEYNMEQVAKCFSVSLELLPKFLYSTFPSIKYDPDNLYKIWLKKLETKEERHQEIIAMQASDFYEATDEIKEQYTTLKGHLQRIQRNLAKFGNL
jgi:hypothetical protein